MSQTANLTNTGLRWNAFLEFPVVELCTMQLWLTKRPMAWVNEIPNGVE